MGFAMAIVAPKGRKHLSADALFRLVRSGFNTIPDHRSPDAESVVFQKWRSIAIDVTLGLTVIASQAREWPMTLIAVRCPHCHSEQMIKRGKTARGYPALPVPERPLHHGELSARLS
jgi:hypothetical protein